MEKYDQQWWSNLKQTCEGLGRLGAFRAFDALTQEVFEDDAGLDCHHTTLQWFRLGEKEGLAPSEL